MSMDSTQKEFLLPGLSQVYLFTGSDSRKFGVVLDNECTKPLLDSIGRYKRFIVVYERVRRIKIFKLLK